MHTLTGHSSWVQSTAFSRDGTRVVSVSHDNLVKIWNVETGAEVRSFVGVRCGWRGGEIMFRAFPASFDLREGGLGDWWGGLSRLVCQERVTYVCLAWHISGW